MTHRNLIRNPAREQITAAIKAAIDSYTGSRTDLARRIGVSRKQTYEWESGNNTPSLETLAALAEVTETPIILAFGPETQQEAAPLDEERLARMERWLRAIAVASGVPSELVAEIEALDRDVDAEVRAGQRNGARHQTADTPSRDG